MRAISLHQPWASLCVTRQLCEFERRDADAYLRAVLARHPSVGSLTEDDAMRLRIQLDQLPTAEEPEVRG